EGIYNLVNFDRDHLRQFNEPTGDKYQSVEEARDSIVNPAEPDKLRLGIWTHREDTGESVMVGSINLTPMDTEAKTAAMGWWVGKQYIRHSYAGKAASLLLEYAFHGAELNMAFCKIALGNAASIKTAQKAGFQLRSSSEPGVGTFVITREE